MKNNFRKYIIWLWVIVFSPILFCFFFIYFIVIGGFGPLPTFEELENPKSNLATEVYSADQKILGKYFIENRSNVRFKDISKNIVDALLATEDARFYTHSGVDGRGLTRVFFKTIVLQQSGAGGGSTITQQLAKNLFPRENISGLDIVIRKIKEWIIAVKLERNYTKDEIIAMYLNTVEFGSNAFGIKSAAHTFFNTTPDQLKLEQAAVLVGLLKAPTYYSPLRNVENSTKRRNVVLNQMLKYKYVTRAAYDSLTTMPIQLDYKSEDHNLGLAPYFREYLRDNFLKKWCEENKKPDGSSYNIYKDGLKVYTTINSVVQQYAEEAVAKHLGGEWQDEFFKHWKGKKEAPFSGVTPQEIDHIMDLSMKRSLRYAILKGGGMSEDSIRKNFKTKVKMTIFTWKGDRDTVMTPMDSIRYYKYFLQSGLISMDPKTGYVKAWVGGINYTYFKFDHVKVGKRQVGSTFKPFVYAVAMDAGYSPCYEVPNVRQTFINERGEVWSPGNSDEEYGGMQSLKYALANSTNSVTAYLVKQFKPPIIVEMAKKLGIKSEIEAVPSICLGTPELSLYEMVGANCTFVNQGVSIEPIFVTRIEDKNGTVLQEFVPKKEEAISEQTAYLMLSLMEGVVQMGTGMRLRFKYKLDPPIAGKTGTTQNNSDGWFIGLTPDLVSGVWVGCEDRAAHFRTTTLGQGASTALPIWAYFMQKVYADSTLNISKDEFEKPSRPVTVETDCIKYKNNQNNLENFDNLESENFDR